MTLVDIVRCMILDADLLKSFWGEILLTTAYIINLSPFVALDSNMLNRV